MIHRAQTVFGIVPTVAGTRGAHRRRWERALPWHRGRHQASSPAVLRDLSDRILTALLVVSILVVSLIGYGLIDNRWYRLVAVTGGSMSPTLEVGDAIVITRPPSRLEPGMVVTMEVDGNVITHRIVSVDPHGGIVTRGDANTVVDDWTDNRLRVVGVQRIRIPWLGGWLRTFRMLTPSGSWFTSTSALPGTALSTDSFGPAAPAP